MTGVLYGVGVGPGDPELMTLKAVKVIEGCDFIGIPAKETASCTAWQIALQAVPSMAQKPVLAVPIPMTTDAARLEEAYEEGCERLAGQLKAGKSIAFLNLGDPVVYGSYMEIHRRVLKAGYTAEVINGVPSFCAVAAVLDLPLGDGKEMIHILPGCYDIRDMEQLSGTKILMKSGRRVGEVKVALCVMEEAGAGKAYAVSNCGMSGEQICRDIRDLPEEAGYFTTIVVKDI